MTYFIRLAAVIKTKYTYWCWFLWTISTFNATNAQFHQLYGNYKSCILTEWWVIFLLNFRTRQACCYANSKLCYSSNNYPKHWWSQSCACQTEVKTYRSHFDSLGFNLFRCWRWKHALDKLVKRGLFVKAWLRKVLKNMTNPLSCQQRPFLNWEQFTKNTLSGLHILFKMILKCNYFKLPF